MNIRTYSVVAALGVATTLFGQEWSQARKEIHDNIRLTGSNYVAYVDPTENLTKAPKGYEPYYLTSYARHGSRWLTGDSQYTDVINPLQKAHDLGKLTDKGEQLLADLKTFHATTYKRIGELTSVGEKQHHRIGKRLTEHFPEIFGAKNCQVDARSTVVIRCILSMEAECEELTRFNKNLKIHNDVSDSFQRYLAPGMDREVSEAINKRGNIVEKYREKWVHPERFCAQLIKDPAYVRDSVNQSRLMRRTFDVCCNMQSHEDGLDMWELFTEEECYDLWRINNIDWYTAYGASRLNDLKAPHRINGLLENFLQTADTIVNNASYRGATMRFGHEVFVLPLATQMELGNSGVTVEDLDTLDHVWANYRIFPMASNIQLIFYRPKKGKKGDILVKALLNEREVSMPAQPVQYPYYRWEDLRKYYQKKLDWNK